MRTWTWVICAILFVMGGYLLVGLYQCRYDQNTTNDTLPADNVEAPLALEAVVRPGLVELESVSDQDQLQLQLRHSSGHSWVSLSFDVSYTGEVSKILTVESCRRDTPRAHCRDDDIHDEYAIRQVMNRRYEEVGLVEEIVFIPRAYSLDE